MKKVLLASFVALLLAIGVGQWLLDDPGYVLVIRGHWRLESSLGLLLLLMLLTWVVSLLLFAILLWLWRLLAPSHLSARVRGHLAGRRLRRGARALGEGEWNRAEKQFQIASAAGWPYLGQLGAAFAAQRLGKRSARDGFLQAAEADQDGGLLAQWLRFYWRAQEGDGKVAAELEEQLAHTPDNLPLRELAAQLAEQQQDWQRLYQHVKRLPSNRVTLSRLRQLWRGRMRLQAEADGDDHSRLEQLHKSWREMPLALRHEPGLLVQYGGYLAQLGEPEMALKLLDDAMTRSWDERYANLLGDIQVLKPADFLGYLDNWLGRYPGVPNLALLAGRTALRANLWGRAEELFRQAGEAGSVAAWAELGRLKQAQGDQKAAHACLLEQTRLVTGKLPALPLPQRQG